MRPVAAILAALSGLVLGAHGTPYMHRVEPAPVYRRPTPVGRSRIKGKPGKPGDKLARMAAEGRLGIGGAEMSAPCCAYPRPDCMGMLVEGIGNRCQALHVEAKPIGNAVIQSVKIDGVEVWRRPSEGTTSARNILRNVPLKGCEFAASGCDYPAGQCDGRCLPGGVEP